MDDFKFVADYWLKHGLNHLSPTQKNKPLCGWWYEYVYKDQEWRRKKKPNAKMLAGVSAQIGWDSYALSNKSEEESVDLAVKDYLKRKGNFLDDEKEMKQFEVNLEAIPLVVKNYIQALNDLDIKKFKTINSERYVNLWMDGIEIPWTGRTDMETEEFFIEDCGNRCSPQVGNNGYGASQNGAPAPNDERGRDGSHRSRLRRSHPPLTCLSVFAPPTFYTVLSDSCSPCRNGRPKAAKLSPCSVLRDRARARF